MNLTDEQKDLLRLLVSNQESYGGKPFIFLRSMTGSGLLYGRDSVPVANDELDFQQLQRENLIVLVPLGPNRWRGKPTERGITFARNALLPNEDPWTTNPFPKGTHWHQAWAESTLWMKEHLALFHAEMLESLPAEEASPKEFLDHHLKTLAGVFDIWAGGLSKTAVLTDDAADAFGHLLIELEKVMLAQANKSRPSFFPERLHSGEVKNRLNQRKQYWTGQMLRRVREHKEASRAAASPVDGAEPSASNVNEPKARPEWGGDTATQEVAPGQPAGAQNAEAGAASDCSVGETAPKKAPDWEDIEVSFIGDHDAEIRVADAESRKVNYKEIAGFEDRRTGKPSQLWAMLRVFGSFPDGTMPDDARTGQEWEAIQKKIQRTAEALRMHFGMTGDPFPYIRGTGYRARIKIRPAPDSPR